MSKKLLLLSAVLFLAGCATGHYKMPWDRGASETPTVTTPAVAPPAAGAPTANNNTLTPPPSTPAAVPPAGPVKVALLLPLSGPQAAIGQALSQAAQLALFDLGGSSFQLMPKDTGATPEGARSATEAAIADGAQLILGPVFAPQVRAASPVASRYGVNMIAFSTDWTLAGSNTFIMGFLPFGQVARIVDYAAAHGVHKIGLFAPNDAYGTAVAGSFGEAVAHDGLMTGTIARFGATQTDLDAAVQSFATAAKQAQCDAVLLPLGGAQARNVADLLVKDGLDPETVRRLGTGLWDDSTLASAPGLQNAWFAAPSPDLRHSFEHRYADTYGQAPPRLATLAYDATALAAVLSKQGTGHKIFDRNALTNPNGFAGLDGVFRFLPNGRAERGLAVLTLRDSGIHVLDPAPRTFQHWSSP